jgi:Transposase and inactivated derivatives
MAKPYDDDLRRKFLAALDRGEGTIPELSPRFGVSVAWGWKISAARKRNGQAERVRHCPGRKRRVGAAVEPQVLTWVRDRADLTLAELQAKLHKEAQISLCLSAVWRLVRRLGLRLKKSHSTQPSATPKPTSSGVRSSLQRFAQPRRNA